MIRRVRTKDSEAVEHFFACPGEKCPDEFCRSQLGEEGKYHCIACHKNVQKANNPKKEIHYLIRHCQRQKTEEGKAKHDFKNPPHNPLLETRITELDNKTIIEGSFYCFSLI